MEPERMAYSQVRPFFQAGDPIRWCGESLLSRGIEHYTGKKTTHISALLDQVRAGELRWLIMEAYEGGHGWFSGHVGDNFLSDRMRGYRGSVIWGQLHPVLDDYRPAIVEELWKLKDVPYDYHGLVKQVRGRVEVDVEALFCSECYQVALHRAIPREVLVNLPMNEAMWMLVNLRPAMQPGDYEGLPIIVREVELLEG